MISNSRLSESIVVLGFGRSGTTWLSDIISKSLGGMLLFEPLHPAVFDRSTEYCYRSEFNKEQSEYLQLFLEAVLSGASEHRWLIRNHVGSPLHEISEEYIRYVWANSGVIGFKSIRANFMVDWFADRQVQKIVYMYRHPLAVIASIIRRSRFWEEYGWPFHWEAFVDRIPVELKAESSISNVLADLEGTVDQIAFMWGVTHRYVSGKLEAMGLPVFRYEDFYNKPFVAVRELLAYLGIDDPALHPSYIFTPSMLTHRTSHEFLTSFDTDSTIDHTVFWQNEITSAQAERVADILKGLGILISGMEVKIDLSTTT